MDCFIQSCDKNLMVPVGGAILASHNKEFPAKVAATYAGRGSSTPALDITITLLEMGVEGWNKLMKERKVCIFFYVIDVNLCQFIIKLLLNMFYKSYIFHNFLSATSNNW